MKTIDIDFYSNRPRLKVRLTWKTDLIPNVGDEIIIESKFISLVDKKFFGEYGGDYDMTFRVKKRLWNLGKKEYPWQNFDVNLEIGWTEEEEKEVDKYLKKLQKKRIKKNK